MGVEKSIGHYIGPYHNKFYFEKENHRYKVSHDCGKFLGHFVNPFKIKEHSFKFLPDKCPSCKLKLSLKEMKAAFILYKNVGGKVKGKSKTIIGISRRTYPILQNKK